MRCGDGTLYTGIATDVERRLSEHGTSRRGAKYLQGRGPLRLVFDCVVGSRSTASKVEHYFKQLPKAHKERFLSRPADLRQHIVDMSIDAPV